MFILIFLLGTIIGSFLNVCIYRIPKDQSICYPPSHCP
ncbi:MAG: prepilin peptidase, partial [Tissierellia bacterium]|nr:prepilin peptidase [Tissierellia bacterium]